MSCKNCGKNEGVRAEPTERQRRQAICKTCEHSEKRPLTDGGFGLAPFGKCAKCQCIITKIALSGKCPIGLW